MSVIVIALLVSLLIGISIIFETMGAWLRYIGSYSKSPTLGYSSHVRVATAGRLFVFLALPLLGHLVDKSLDSYVLAGIAAVSFLFSGLVMVVLNSTVEYWGPKLYDLLNTTQCGAFRTTALAGRGDSSLNRASMISFGLISCGVFVVNYLATFFPDNRAAIVQASAGITMFGTLIHAFWVDPRLSKLCDHDTESAHDGVRSFVSGRIKGAFVLSVIFSIAFAWNFI